MAKNVRYGHLLHQFYTLLGLNSQKKIDHISEIWAINDHKSEIFYCMKADSVRDQPKIDHIAEKTIYPKTI